MLDRRRALLKAIKKIYPAVADVFRSRAELCGRQRSARTACFPDGLPALQRQTNGIQFHQNIPDDAVAVPFRPLCITGLPGRNVDGSRCYFSRTAMIQRIASGTGRGCLRSCAEPGVEQTRTEGRLSAIPLRAGDSQHGTFMDRANTLIVLPSTDANAKSGDFIKIPKYLPVCQAGPNVADANVRGQAGKDPHQTGIDFARLAR